MVALADIGGVQNAKPLGVCGHDSVLDSVVDHLDEVTGAVRPTVEISALGSPAVGLPSGSAGDVAGAGSKLREDRIETLHDRRFAADHEAISALASPDATAGPDVDIVDALSGKLLRAADVVDVVGVATVDEDVAGRELGGELGDGRVHGSGRDHQPDGPWRLQLLHEIRGRRGADRLGPRELFDRLRGPVVHHALMAAGEQTMNHVRAHAAESDHSELHSWLL